MEYTITVKYVPPFKLGKYRNLVYDNITEQITLTNEEGTKFTNKQDIKRLLVDMIANRDKYKSLVEGSGYMEVWVKKKVGNVGSYDDQLTIKFD